MGGFRECEEYVRIVHELYYIYLSHMHVKWNEIRYIPIRYQFFAGWEDLVPIIHIRSLQNVKIVVQERVFMC